MHRKKLKSDVEEDILVVDSTSLHSPETRPSSKLVVQMPNLHSKHKRSLTATKRINRAVSVANRKIDFPKKEKQELLRNNWSLKKSVLRRAKAQSCQTTPHKSTEMSMLTPRRKSRQQLRAGLLSLCYAKG